jgi:hypothetical protein
MATKAQKEELIEILKFTPRTYTIYIGGYGGESYAGKVDKETYNYFKENKIDIEEFANDWDDKFSDVPSELQPFSPGSPYDCDNLFHCSGAELSNLNEIQINDEQGNEHWTCAAGFDELAEQGVSVDESGGFEFDELQDDEVAFWGGQGEKGTFFDGEIELKQPFDPKKLSITYENCDGWYLISEVHYDGEWIDGSGGYSTTGKWTEFKWIVGDGVETYEPVSREDQDEDEESDEELPTIQELEDDLEEWDPVAELDKISEGMMTEWFSKDIKPERKGEYEIELLQAAWPFASVGRAEWTGRSWKQNGEKIEIKQWRGLKFDPSEALK